MENVFDRIKDATEKISGAVKTTVQTMSGAAQKMAANVQAAPQRQANSSSWYKGETPTTSEVLARIYTIGNEDRETGQMLYEQFNAMRQDASSPYYSPYKNATNTQAISALSELGVDVSRGVDDQFLQEYSWLKNHYRTGAGGTPLAPSSASTREEDAAYWYYKLLAGEETTRKAEREWAALKKEVAYWAQREDRNYSDEEILSRIDWSQYSTLSGLDEAAAKGTPAQLNRAIDYSRDALTGVIWAARNGESTGDAELDAVQSALGRGKTWQRDAAASARLTPGSDTYNPYAVGSTQVRSLGDDIIEYGEGMTNITASKLAGNDAYLRENATTLEYFVAQGGSEAIKMGASAFAGRAIAAGAQIGGQLTPVLAANKLELLGRVAAMSPFIAESGAAQGVATYAETGEYGTALLASVVSAATTLATSDVGVFKAIEQTGQPYLAEVVKAASAVQGSGTAAALARWGKAGMMYMGNLFKVAINEGGQEVLENLVSTSATDALTGRNFFARDMGGYARELTGDFIWGAISSFGATAQTLPSYARSVVVAEQNMGKTAITAGDAARQIQAFAQDLRDEPLMRGAVERAVEQAAQARTGELIAEGALEDAPAETRRLETAQSRAEAGRRALEIAREEHAQAVRAVASAQERLNQNPADAQAASDVKRAIDDWTTTARGLRASEADAALAERELTQANAALASAQNAALERVRAQARAEVEAAIRTPADAEVGVDAGAKNAAANRDGAGLQLGTEDGLLGRLSQRTGLTFAQSDAQDAPGMYNPATRTITFGRDVTEEQAALYVARHELRTSRRARRNTARMPILCCKTSLETMRGCWAST